LLAQGRWTLLPPLKGPPQELSAHAELDTPIADAVAALCQGRASVQDVMAELLNRPLKQE
jgi:glycerol-3-phosphate dehydrogenase